jgi:hypothetical protein
LLISSSLSSLLLYPVPSAKSIQSSFRCHQFDRNHFAQPTDERYFWAQVYFLWFPDDCCFILFSCNKLTNI